MKLPNFDYASPTSLDEALALLSQPDARPLAGGQSLLPVMAFRLAAPASLVDLRRVGGLDAITITDTTITIGAMVRWNAVERHQGLKDALPLLAEAIGHVAHYQIKTRGTVGGSLAHADPAAEFPGIAVTCDAKVHVRSQSGHRIIAAADLIVGPLETSLTDGELITSVEFPIWPRGRRWAFEEFARRRGDFALAGIAVFYDLDARGAVANAHVGVIGATDRARRLSQAEAALNGRQLEAASIAAAVAAARAEVQPNADIHGSADYRRSLVGTLLERALIKAAG